MAKTTKFKSVQAYIDAQPRSISQREIAERLGIPQDTLSRLKHGWIPRKSDVLEKLRAAGIEVAA